MVVRLKRAWATVSACAAALLLGACGGQAQTSQTGPVGDPVAGGSARILAVSEPRSLDPAILTNSASTNGILGNSLYGTLMVNDMVTGKIEYKMAEAFTTADSGKTFEMRLREGLTFSDGTPLDASAVKFNWDRVKDPATGSQSLREAALIASTEAVDPRTLKITLVSPVPLYAQAVVASSLNWIASPKALQAGGQVFNAAPVGAGPFTLKSWARQDRIELVKNPRYWDAPKPYLDAITFRSVTDTTQRIDALDTGGADLAVNTSWESIEHSRDRGLGVEIAPLSGGLGLTLNTRRAPFDDLRARQAVAAAVDLEAMNLAVFNGAGRVPETLFEKSSPFYSDIPLTKTDRGTAQRLFDELAAEGKPVKFTFTAYTTPESRDVAESLQAQLSSFRNVSMQIKMVDLSAFPQINATKDYDVLISAAYVLDPEPQLWASFHGKSSANGSGINDPQLNEALDAGRRGQTVEQRKAAYEVVQERLAELVPMIFYTRASQGATTVSGIHGVVHYGNASLLTEELWKQG